MRQLSEKVAHIESQMATSQQQQLSLEALYKDLSQGRDQWTLAEIEQVLLTAAQRYCSWQATSRPRSLRWKVPTTVCASRQAAVHCAAPRDCADLTNLRAVPSLDMVGAVRVSRRSRHAMPDGPWPARRFPRRRRRRAAAAGPAISPGTGTELKRLAQIRRIDGNEAVLAAARAGLFPARESAPASAVGTAGVDVAGPGAFQTDLRAVSELLSRYYNTRDAGVAAALKEIKRLSGLQVAQKLPGIDASLSPRSTRTRESTDALADLADHRRGAGHRAGDGRTLRSRLCVLVYPPWRVEISFISFVLMLVGLWWGGIVLLRLAMLTLNLPGIVREQRARRAARKRDENFVGGLKRIPNTAIRTPSNRSGSGRATTPGSGWRACWRRAPRRKCVPSRCASVIFRRLRARRRTCRAAVRSRGASRHQGCGGGTVAINRAKEIAPQHTALLRLELKARQMTGQWDEVDKLLDALMRGNALEPGVAAQIRRMAYAENLKRRTEDDRGLLEYWKKIPADFKVNPWVARAAARAFMQRGSHDTALDVLEAALKREWHEDLAALYGEVRAAARRAD